MVSVGWFAALELCGLRLTSRCWCFECLIVGLLLWWHGGILCLCYKFWAWVVVRLLGVVWGGLILVYGLL